MVIEIKKQSSQSWYHRRWFPAVGISQMSAGAVPPTAPAPAGKLPEGWHSTERYGDIFVSPSGRAWGVKIIGTKFENVVVDVRAADFIGQSVIERRKEAVRKSVRRQSVQGQRTKPPILTAQRETSTAHEGIGGSL